jgi:hypothetical protein
MFTSRKNYGAFDVVALQFCVGYSIISSINLMILSKGTDN